jgi:hypothetical protein
VQDALRSDKPEQVYLALWCLAFVDATEAMRLARGLLSHADAEVRYATAHLLTQLALAPARTMLAPLVDDPDLRVASLVLGQFQRGTGWDLSKDPDKVFVRLGRLYERVPKGWRRGTCRGVAVDRAKDRTLGRSECHGQRRERPEGERVHPVRRRDGADRAQMDRDPLGLGEASGSADT